MSLSEFVTNTNLRASLLNDPFISLVLSGESDWQMALLPRTETAPAPISRVRVPWQIQMDTIPHWPITGTHPAADTLRPLIHIYRITSHEDPTSQESYIGVAPSQSAIPQIAADFGEGWCQVVVGAFRHREALASA